MQDIPSAQARRTSPRATPPSSSLELGHNLTDPKTASKPERSARRALRASRQQARATRREAQWN